MDDRMNEPKRMATRLQIVFDYKLQRQQIVNGKPMFAYFDWNRIRVFRTSIYRPLFFFFFCLFYYLKSLVDLDLHFN